MDEYLSDKEQVERLRQWWRENGWFLIGGVALGLLALYGYNQYFAYQDRQVRSRGGVVRAGQAGNRRQRYRRRRRRAFARAAQRVPGPRLYASGRAALGERRGRHGARQRGREAAFHDGAERRPRARDGGAPAARARARVSRAVSGGARAAERARARPVRGPHRRDQRRHPRRRSARRMRRARRISKRWWRPAPSCSTAASCK